ncbi:lipid-A-disaccharide synthase [Fulvivirga ligni]|uniref:lipid-A-disaccharide synthase n=1 Tax=Fulvivirga ligni TaxID=2904246 RepID=UPI001F3ACA9F|nr:lipid-A-disaccharide synthase [Fulvivirga ligni]UII23504.1 lipid-A-disaccharide synthase [Fulvivirga ligni]
MKYYIIAGERSGDLHSSNLIKSIKQLDSQAEFKGYGGDYMQEAGAEISVHYKDLAFMGFLEVVKNLRTIKGYLKRCKQEILDYKPNAIILVDYAGFNLKIAGFAKKHNIPVYYYISPKVWAWNQKRAWKIKDRVDHMMTIMPFEKEFYKKFDWEVDYVGNPVLDAVKSHQVSADKLNGITDYVAILPGSRKQELESILPTLSKVVDAFPEMKFAVAAVNNLPEDSYSVIADKPNVQLFEGSTYDLLAGAKAAIVTSGTATLETAMWEVPQIVVYKTSGVSYAIAKSLIKVPYISLVNLIADKEVVRELIQKEMNPQSIQKELNRVLNDSDYRQNMLSDYQKIKKKLDIGRASDNAAKIIVDRMKS